MVTNKNSSDNSTLLPTKAASCLPQKRKLDQKTDGASPEDQAKKKKNGDNSGLGTTKGMQPLSAVDNTALCVLYFLSPICNQVTFTVGVL
jgi:hypothetical protein